MTWELDVKEAREDPLTPQSCEIIKQFFLQIPFAHHWTLFSIHSSQIAPIKQRVKRVQTINIYTLIENLDYF